MNMKKMVLLASAVALIASSGLVARAEDEAAAPDADCNRVIKAASETDKKPSPKQLSEELKLPLEKVNACLLKVRHQGSGAPPAAPH